MVNNEMIKRVKEILQERVIAMERYFISSSSQLRNRETTGILGTITKEELKMEPKRFDEIMEIQLSACREVLKSKETIYSSGGDRFGNFIKAGELQGRTPESALFGHLSKHLVAISDNVDNPSAKSFPAWTEWITDSINYLILLRGMIEERMGRTWKIDGTPITKPFAKVFQPTQNVTLDESDLSLSEIDQS